MQYSDGDKIVGRTTFPYRFYKCKFMFKFIRWVWRATGIDKRAKRYLKKWIAIFAPAGASR